MVVWVLGERCGVENWSRIPGQSCTHRMSLHMAHLGQGLARLSRSNEKLKGQNYKISGITESLLKINLDCDNTLIKQNYTNHPQLQWQFRTKILFIYLFLAKNKVRPDKGRADSLLPNLCSIIKMNGLGPVAMVFIFDSPCIDPPHGLLMVCTTIRGNYNL